MLSILLFAGGLLRFYNLSHLILYWDEPLHCIRIAYQPLPFVLAYNNASAFFALLVHLLLPLGKIELMARLPSACFGVLSIVAIYFLGKFFFSKKEGLIVAAFIAFSPFLIRHSQYSRAYSIFTFFSILSFYFFFKAIKENKAKFWVFYWLSNAINIYNHLFAFLIIPVYALYMGLIWLRGRIVSQQKGKGNQETEKLKKFILWTLLLFILVFLLYIPDVNTRSFLLDSFKRVKTHPPSETSASLFLINEILWNQIEPQNLFFYIFVILFALLGLASALKKHFMETLFFPLCMFLPLLVFIAIKPRAVNVLSADRYFIFILPLLFLLTARGITACSTGAALALSRIKFIHLNKGLLTKITASILLIILIGGGFNLKHYYLNFWRLGSLRVEKEVRNFLQENVKEDSLIFFDFFPASSLILVVNPLTKNLKTHEFDAVIRKDLEVTKNKKDIMIYKISEHVFEWFVHKDVGLWAVTRLDSKKHKKLLSLIKDSPKIRAIPLRNHTILHFEKNSKPLSLKLAKMVEIFLSLDPIKGKEKELRLLAAKTYLRSNNIEEAYRELRRAQKIVLSPSEAKIQESPFGFQILDKIFGYSHQELRQRAQEYFYEADIARLLYRQGNHFLAQKGYGKALRVYSECLALKEDYNLKISKRVALIGDGLFIKGDTEKASTLYKKALQLDPQRYDLNFRLAEAYRKGGYLPEAREEYKKTFNLDALSSEILHKIAQSPQLVIIWEKNSVWHLLFRSKQKSIFSGCISGSRKIKDVRKFRFSEEDSLNLKGNEIHFSLKTTKRKIKAFDFIVPKNSRLTFDLEVNDQRKIEKILLLGKSRRPKKIPFSIK